MTDISLNDALEPGETWQQSVERRLRELDTKTPALGDLPLAALQRKLENDWQPDGNVLLLPGSVTFDVVDLSILGIAGQTGKRKVAVGATTLTWPAGVATSNLATPNHGLGVAPVAVVCSGQAGGFGIGDFWAAATTFTATTFQVRGNFTANWPAGGTQTVYWIAIG